MAIAQENPQIISENIELVSSGSEDLESQETNDETNERSQLAGLIKRSRGYLLGLAFVAGLLLGWLVIGWLLWPVQWANSEPWNLQPRHQRTFVRLVAADYWQTSDIARAREALAGWDKEALAGLLATMEKQTSSPEERQHLAALAEALETPDTTESLASLLNQKAILLSSILSASPLVAALAFAAYSLVQNRTQQAEKLLAIEEQIETELEEALAQGEEGEGQEQQGEPQEQQGEPQEQEQQEQQDTEKEEEKYEEDDEEESEPWIQDFVSNLFDEEDTELAQIQAICKNLPDIDGLELLQHSKQTANDLCRGNALR